MTLILNRPGIGVLETSAVLVDQIDCVLLLVGAVNHYGGGWRSGRGAGAVWLQESEYSRDGRPHNPKDGSAHRSPRCYLCNLDGSLMFSRRGRLNYRDRTRRNGDRRWSRSYSAVQQQIELCPTKRYIVSGQGLTYPSTDGSSVLAVLIRRGAVDR